MAIFLKLARDAHAQLVLIGGDVQDLDEPERVVWEGFLNLKLTELSALYYVIHHSEKNWRASIHAFRAGCSIEDGM